MRTGSATSECGGPTCGVCTAPGRSAHRTCTPGTTRRSCCCRRKAAMCPATTRGSPSSWTPRNDVHLFTSQIAVAFIKLCNRLVDRLREDGTAEDALLEKARRAATRHYQHVIVREFLPGLIGARLGTQLLQHGPQLYLVDGDPYIRSGSPTPPTATATPRSARRRVQVGRLPQPPDQQLLPDKRRHATPGLPTGRRNRGSTGAGSPSRSLPEQARVRPAATGTARTERRAASARFRPSARRLTPGPRRARCGRPAGSRRGSTRWTPCIGTGS